MKEAIRHIIAMCCAASMMMTMALPVYAGDTLSLSYQLSVNGSSTVSAETGDVLTVTFAISRQDQTENYKLYAIDNDIEYDDSFFAPVGDVTIVSGNHSVAAFDERLVENQAILRFNDYACSYEANQTICKFQMKVIGTAGSSVIRCSEALAYDAKGEAAKIDCKNLTVKIDNTKPSKKKSETEPQQNVNNGSVFVTVTNAEADSRIAEAKSTGSETVVFEPETSGAGANTTNVSIPGAVANSIVESKLGIQLKAADGSIAALDSKAVQSFAGQSSGRDLKLVMSRLSQADAVSAIAKVNIDQERLQNSKIEAIQFFAGDSAVTSFDGCLTLSLTAPAGLKAGDTNVVYQVSDDGMVEKHIAVVKMIGGALYSEITTTHLSTFLVSDESGLPFTDITGHWAVEAIAYAFEQDLFRGVTDTTFGPNAAMTRAMLVGVLYRMEGSPAVTGANSFVDVKKGQWYLDAVIWGQQAGIVTGYNNTTFGPNDKITREQMAQILMRYAKMKNDPVSETGDLSPFTDRSSTSPWALEAMCWANAKGLITGYTATILAPQETATRAQVASILMRFARIL